MSTQGCRQVCPSRCPKVLDRISRLVTYFLAFFPDLFPAFFSGTPRKVVWKRPLPRKLRKKSLKRGSWTLLGVQKAWKKSKKSRKRAKNPKKNLKNSHFRLFFEFFRGPRTLFLIFFEFFRERPCWSCRRPTMSQQKQPQPSRVFWWTNFKHTVRVKNYYRQSCYSWEFISRKLPLPLPSWNSDELPLPPLPSWRPQSPLHFHWLPITV